jgi:hypothetical protein
VNLYTPIEARVRVEICLPYRNKPEYITTINWVIERFRSQYMGVTLSIHQPLPVFRGFYFSDEEQRVLRDRVIYVFCDVEIHPEHEVEELEAYLRVIKEELHLRLEDEKEFWITYYPLTRIVAPKRSDVLRPKTDPPGTGSEAS